MIRESTLDGLALKQFYFDIFCGRPYIQRITKPVKLNPDQEAVARGDATPEQRERAKKLKKFTTFRTKVYPTLAERELAAQWLTERGWGKAPQIIEQGSGDVQGFVIEMRHWAPGMDPLDPKYSRERMIEERKAKLAELARKKQEARRLALEAEQGAEPEPDAPPAL
jgi:hypothetical protein